MAKTLPTTNTTWRATVQRCRRLVTLGEPATDAEIAFSDQPIGACCGRALGMNVMKNNLAERAKASAPRQGNGRSRR